MARISLFTRLVRLLNANQAGEILVLFRANKVLNRGGYISGMSARCMT
jgi:hypothetical protein